MAEQKMGFPLLNYRSRVSVSRDKANVMNTRQETMINALGEGDLALPSFAHPQTVSAPSYGTPADRSEVPAGYKRTEVGVIPSDWDVMKIGDLFESTAGGDFDSTRSSDVQSDSHPYPIFANGLSQEGLYGFSDYAENRTGSITITARGTLGVAFYRDTPFVAIGRLLVLKPKIRMDARYFSSYINHGVQFAIESTGVPQLTAPQVTRYSAPVPPETEQRDIAEALSDVDGLHAALETLIAKKQAIKRAAMQQLLIGMTRLPGFSGAWETTTLGDIAEIYSGATPNTQVSAYWNGRIPWCTPTDITAMPGKYLRATERSVTEEGLVSCSARLLPAGSLLLCSRATIGEIKIAVSPVCTNQGFKSLVCKTDVSNEFLYYLLLTLKPQLIERAIGSTFLEISKSDVASLSLRIPTHTEQHAIAAILSDMDDEITALEHRRYKMRAIKQGMIQQLLTGRVRLVESERAANV